MEKRRGITLIEILVVLFIMGLIAIALYNVLSTGMKGWRVGKERTDIIAQARVAMDRLTRELRATGGIEAAEYTYIYFSTDLDADGSENEISYSWPSGTELFRGLGASPDYKVIARSIDNFSLYYYSKDGTQITPPTGTNTQEKRNMIWMVEIEARVKEDDNTVNLRSTVQPRNYSYTQ